MKAILHIGTEKTGTTTIQNGLRLNKKKLYKKGYFVPESLSGGLGKCNHVKLACYAMNDIKENNLKKLEGINQQKQMRSYRQQVQEKFREELDGCTVSNVILSNEHCSSRLVQPREISRLKAFLDCFFDEVKIIVYLRRQEELLISGFSTAITTGSKHKMISPEKYSKQVNRFNYYQLLNKWSKVFGKGNIDVNVFEPSNLKGGDVFIDFMRKFKVRRIKVPKKKYNTSLNFPKLEFLRRINKDVPRMSGNKVNPRWRAILRALEELDYPGPSVNELLTDEYVGIYDESNRKVAKEYLGRMDGQLFGNQGNYKAKSGVGLELSDDEFLKMFREVSLKIERN
ncbi:hypothetical protein [Virgibacillus siamensis]|uniref:hypothetical protein n=1 Tax=Virgibacillus siamensis TaxID=480071 RepID=UPI0009852C7C|nr:hypothetical protein [Virgibacillus siamensis]